MKTIQRIGAVTALLVALVAAPAFAKGGDSDSHRGRRYRPQASQPIPEPTAAVLFGLGALGAGWATKRRRP